MHSDRGSQYTSWIFGHGLRASGLLGSMGRVPSSVDNGMIDSFWSTMQRELFDRRSWTSRAELGSAIFEWIDVPQPAMAPLRARLPVAAPLRTASHRPRSPRHDHPTRRVGEPGQAPDLRVPRSCLGRAVGFGGGGAVTGFVGGNSIAARRPTVSWRRRPDAAYPIESTRVGRASLGTRGSLAASWLLRRTCPGQRVCARSSAGSMQGRSGRLGRSGMAEVGSGCRSAERVMSASRP
jgi:hypothetical protein